MKHDPQTDKLEQALHASKLVAGGFMGSDARPSREIIEADLATLDRLGRTTVEVATRMQALTDLARQNLEVPVQTDPHTEVSILDTRGRVPCPWPHPGVHRKGVVTLRRLDLSDSIRWSELNIHLIETHAFFQGHGSFFRLDPAHLVRLLF